MQPWVVDWPLPVEASVRWIHPWTAADLARAVYRFAASGEGDVEAVEGDPHGLWLYVPGAGAYLEVDPRTRTIVVLAAFRAP
jgi:hypothetical protein